VESEGECMIEPVLKDEAFLLDVKRAREEVDCFHLWWLGQSGFLLQWKHKHILLDPYLSDSLTVKYARTEKPHVRMTARVVSPRCLDFIDVVTSSHNHTDHLDAATLKPLLEANPKLEIVIPEANRTVVTDRLDTMTDLPVGLDAGKTAKVAGFTFHGIAAAHEQIEKDDYGCCTHLGYIIEFDRWKVYHSGDTMLYPGMVECLRPRSIDVAILPINGRAPERRVAGNLTGAEAATLAKEIGARLVIPCHYEMFEFNTASPEEFERTAERLRQPCKVLRCGERWSSSELGRPGGS
jgi:L-ascorbate metabolism protein UlaG (beta-lactamase superfamily)